MRYICPICSKEIKYSDTIDGLCPECYLARKNIVKYDFFKNRKFIICKYCGAILDKNKWKYFDAPMETVFWKLLEQDIPNFIDSALKYKVNLSSYSVNINSSKEGIFDFELTIEFYNISVKQRHHFSIPVIFSTCDKCSKIRTGYFEAYVRFKRENTKLDQETKEKIKQALKVFMTQYFKNPKGFVLKLLEKKNYIEAKVGSGTIAKSIGNFFKKNFNARVTISSKLIGMQAGKQKFQLAVSIELPQYKKGDILIIENEDIVRVEKVSPKGILVQSMFENRKYQLLKEYNKWKKIEKIDQQKLDQYQIISISKDKIQIMNLKTFEISDISKVDLPRFLSKDDIFKGILFKNKLIFLAKSNMKVK